MPTPPNPQAIAYAEGRAKGARSEDVAAWYFRLNGFFAIPGFAVHLDSANAVIGREGEPRRVRTEADLMAVRFPFSREVIAEREMEDDRRLLAPTAHLGVPLFVLVEVKAGRCRMNGPWTDRRAQNMQRVIRRLGFANSEPEIHSAAEALYEHAYWQDERAVIQYVCVGAEKDPSLTERHDGLVQIDWHEIGVFLYHRFRAFPEELPSGLVYDQWPTFGRKFGNWFAQIGRQANEGKSGQAVQSYVRTGSLPVV
jgi:hypothetical protein